MDVTQVKIGQMRDYLPVADIVPYLGQGERVLAEAWSLWSWGATPASRVRLRELTAIQRYLNPGLVLRYVRSNRRRSEGLLPCVVSHNGRHYIADGHHRVVAAIERGESHIDAHVKSVS